VHVLNTLTDMNRIVGEIVVIDVFRSSSTIVELLEAGAEVVVAVESLEEARRLGREHPRWLLLGERNGLDVEGFHGGNSPVEARNLVRERHTAVLTTSGGTRVMRACGERAFWIGCFRNAEALVARLAGADEVSLWAVGRAGQECAEEDVACAEYLAARLRGELPEFAPIRERLMTSPGAERLRQRGCSEDLDWCLQVDRRGITPHRTGTKEGWPCLTN